MGRDEFHPIKRFISFDEAAEWLSTQLGEGGEGVRAGTL